MKPPSTPPTVPVQRKPTVLNIPSKRMSRASARLSMDEIVDDVERREGVSDPSIVMVVVRAYRSLELTNRAQKDLIQKLGHELATLKAESKGKKKP